MLRARRSLIGVVCALAVSLTAGAIAVAAPHSRHVSRTHRHHARAAVTNPTAYYSVLTQPATTADVLDPTIRLANLPVDRSSSRALPVPSGAFRAWITTGSNLVCISILGNGGGASCEFADRATQGLSMTLEPSGSDPSLIDLVGIAPDGIKSVTVTLADGRTVDLAVNDNAYSAETDSRPVQATYVGPNGAYTRAI